MSTDAWGKLWDLAVDDPDGPATIEVDPELCDRVTLVYPDGSRGGWIWHGNGWRAMEPYNSAPCDVAARDAL